MKNKLIVSLLIILISVYIGYHPFSKDDNPIKDISNMEILAITMSNHEGRKSVIMNECVSLNEDINDSHLYNYQLKGKVEDFFTSLAIDFDNTVEGRNHVNINSYHMRVAVIYNSSLKFIDLYFSDEHNSIHVATYSNKSSVIKSYDAGLLSTILENITSETSGFGFSYETMKC